QAGRLPDDRSYRAALPVWLRGGRPAGGRSRGRRPPEPDVNGPDDLRALVREVIRDVLPQGLAVTETVNLSTDEDLAAFVKRLLDLDPGQREELRSGRKRFRLASPQAPSVPAGAGQSGAGSINGAERAGPSAPVRRIER